MLERIHRAAVSRYAAVLVAAFFFGTAAFWLHNTLNRLAGTSYRDEGLTLVRGIGSLAPPHKVRDVRVGETNRWFARLLHPAGVLYMNLNGYVEEEEAEGGEAGTDAKAGRAAAWAWPVYTGDSYLEKRFTDSRDLDQDPNIQDFTLFMRLAFGLIAAASFCLVLWALCGRFGFPAAAAYGSLILGSPLVFDQFRLFYSETTMFIVFNLGAALYLRYAAGGGSGVGGGEDGAGGGRAADPPLSLRTAAGFGLLCAAALSTKLAGGVIAAMLACTLLVNVLRGRHDPAPRIEVWLASFLAFLYLINVPFAGSVFEYVNQTLHNVYHYASRHRIFPGWNFYMPLEDDTGVVELLSSVPGLGPLIVLAFPAALLWLALRPRRGMLPVYVLGAGVVLTVSYFSNQMFYLVRDFASLYVAASFVVAVAVGDLLATAPERKLAVACASPVLALALLAAGAHLLWQTKPLQEAFFEEVRSHGLSQCDSVAGIGLPESGVRTLREIGGGGEGAFAKYHEHECLIVHRGDGADARRFANFVAPTYYRVQRRIGEFFFFVIAPPAFADLAATGGKGSISLSWTTPFQPQAVRDRFRSKPAEAVRYQFRLKAGYALWPGWKDLPAYESEGRSNRLVLQGLDGGLSYRVRLRARYGGGFGDWGPTAEVSATPRGRP